MGAEPPRAPTQAFFLAAGGDFAALHEYGCVLVAHARCRRSWTSAPHFSRNHAPVVVAAHLVTFATVCNLSSVTDTALSPRRSPDAAAFGGENLRHHAAAAHLHMGPPHAGGGAAGGETLTEDEALARQLQEEEAREWSGRMLAMAGVVPGAHGGGEAPMLEGEDEDDEEGEEGDIGLDVDAMSYEELLALGDAAGHVSRGVSASVVARLPTRTFAEPAGAAAPAMCLICRQDYVAGDCVMDLPCAHNFHSDCITPWLTTVNKACPCCKREVTPRKVERMADKEGGMRI